MSMIHFHSLDGEVEVSGSERYYAVDLAGSLLCTVLGPHRDYRENERDSVYYQIIPKESYCWDGDRLLQNSVETYLRSLHHPLVVGEAEVSSLSVALNTLYRSGNDAMKLLARLHGQCEMHAWVAGKDRDWLARIIEEGRKSNLLRPQQGWEDVVELLRARRSHDDEPVVTSYSVSQPFPNAFLAGISPDDEEARIAWDELSYEEQWGSAFAALERKQGLLQLEPEGWDAFYFREGISAWDIMAAFEERTAQR